MIMTDNISNKIQNKFDELMAYYKALLVESRKKFEEYERYSDSLYDKYVKLPAGTEKDRKDFYKLIYDDKLFSYRASEEVRIAYVLKVLFSTDPSITISEADRKMLFEGELAGFGELLFAVEDGGLVLKNEELDKEILAGARYVIDGLDKKQMDEYHNGFQAQMNQMKLSRENYLKEQQKVAREAAKAEKNESNGQEAGDTE